MLLLEPETPTYRGYLHEVNTHLDHLDISVDEDIANAVVTLADVSWIS
jgi:hypothetical protein